MDELKNGGFWPSSKPDSKFYLPCVWGGISCDHITKGVQVTKRVKFLNLSGAGSQQAFWSLPDVLFVKGWSGLRYLDLSNTNIEGSLQDDAFGEATELQHLDLSKT